MTLRTKGFEATVRVIPGTDLAVIDLKGDIDDRAAPHLDRAAAEALTHRPARLLLNFSGVDYINSIGIALIVGLLARARQERINVLATGLSDHYREIFEITSLSDFMTIVADEASVIDSAPPAA
jgi:anti-anti-sigma factor